MGTNKSQSFYESPDLILPPLFVCFISVGWLWAGFGMCNVGSSLERGTSQAETLLKGLVDFSFCH